jgi:hypothetical protein
MCSVSPPADAYCTTCARVGSCRHFLASHGHKWILYPLPKQAILVDQAQPVPSFGRWQERGYTPRTWCAGPDTQHHDVPQVPPSIASGGPNGRPQKTSDDPPRRCRDTGTARKCTMVRPRTSVVLQHLCPVPAFARMCAHACCT